MDQKGYRVQARMVRRYVVVNAAGRVVGRAAGYTTVARARRAAELWLAEETPRGGGGPEAEDDTDAVAREAYEWWLEECATSAVARGG